MTTSIPSRVTKTLYEEDFYQWIQVTAQSLKEGRFEAIEWENLIEEIESMGRSEKKEIKSRLTILLEHLLKLIYWEAEKADNARGWRGTIVEQRRQIKFSLEDSPSLRNLLPEIFLNCYQTARKDTLQKCNLPANLFPIKPPFSLEDVLNSDYLPE